MPELTKELLNGLGCTGPTDPIEYYRRPLVGWLFRRRINIGLDLLGDGELGDVLEVGYGAGAVLLALASNARTLSGIDLDADPKPVEALLAQRGRAAELRQCSVYELPYAGASFDLVVSFSVFEHLHDYPRALVEVARVLRPGGRFLLGMPAVNVLMEAGFRAIGFRGIGHHHVTPPAKVARRFRDSGFVLLGQRTLGVPAPGLRLYSTWLLEKR